MSNKIVFLFSGNMELSILLDQLIASGPLNELIILEHLDCGSAKNLAEQAEDQIRILQPNAKVSVTQSLDVLETADFIVIPGLGLPFKDMNQFLPIVYNAFRGTFANQEVKEGARIIIHGSFRGLLMAGLLGRINPVMKPNIVVVDPIVFAGSRVLGTGNEDGMVYPVQEGLEFVQGTTTLTADQKAKIVILMRRTINAINHNEKTRRFDLVDATSLSEAIQLISEGNEEGIMLMGRYPLDNEPITYGIDADVPVFLPSQPETRLKTRIALACNHVKTALTSFLSSQER